ncbi:MAG: hypothetical protein KKG75_03795, partial [Nanoarchaeota archaeon]|nr:hypothetical protein [Nanoarchaeota archaeon]
MTSVMETVIAIRSPFESLWVNFLKFFPDLVAVLLLLFIGYIFGAVLGHVLKIVLNKAGVDRQIERAELSKAIGKTHLSSILGEILKWYIFIVFLRAAVDKINLGALSDVLNGFVTWLPNLILAVVIVIFGMIFAHYVEIKINQSSKVKGVSAITKVLKWIIVFMVVIIALKQIGIDVSILENAFLLILGAIAIGIALALGIGLGFGLRKDAEKWIKDIMNNF